MERRAGSLGFMAVTIILVLVTAFFCAGTVMSRTDFDARELESYYREKESRLVKDTWTYLNRQGFADSGVMLTRVVEADGSRAYTVTVHHGRLDSLSEAEREQLAEELEELAFQDDSCSFRVRLTEDF